MKIKIGVTGYTSQIGQYLIQKGCIPLDLDITKRNSIDGELARKKPHIIVNLASKSDPDWCEANYEEALAVNVYGFSELCSVADKRAIPIVALSTDHIFSGKTYFDWKMKRIIHSGPYRETYSRPIPVNAYGMSKLGMETVASLYDSVKVVRTSYCFDQKRLQNDMNKLQDKFYMAYPTFLYRSFLHTEHFTNIFMIYLQKFFDMPRILHISGSETISWFEFMKAVADKYGYDTVRSRNKEDIDLGRAHRPYKSGLHVDLSEKLGLPQFSYLDGINLL